MVADPYVTNALFDLKGDGALAPFEDLASVYHDGSEGPTLKALAEHLRWAKEVESPRRAKIIKELTKARLCPDAKLTREIARNPEHDIDLMVVTVDEAQIGTLDRKYGAEISDGMVHLAKYGRSLGMRVKIRTQDPDSKSVPTALNEMLPTRIAGRCDDWQVSKATLLTNRLRADLMPDGVEGGFYIRQAGNRFAKVIGYYVDVDQAWDFTRKVTELRRGTGGPVPADARPQAPKVLTELHRLASDPDRCGRIPSSEAAAAMIAYGLIEITDADRVGHEKPEEQIRQEKLAGLVRPFNVRTRPDPNNGNRAAYWVEREHRDYGDVGTGQGIIRAERPGFDPGLADSDDGLRSGLPKRLRRLRAV